MVNVALIGHGYWGTKLEKYIKADKHFSLKCICNSKSDLNEVWVDDGIDAVVIAVRNEQRYPITKMALESGKSVLSEKPLALTSIEAESLRNLANLHSLILAVNYTFTFSKGLQRAVKWVRDGKIGTLLGIDMCVNHLGKFGGGSVYWILGSHMLSVLGMFIPLESLFYGKRDMVVYNGSVETGVILFGRFDFKGQMTLSLNYPGKEVKVVLYGSDGTIVYNPNQEHSLSLRIYERKTWVVDSEIHGQHLIYAQDEANNLKYAFEYFYKVIKRETASNVDTAVTITKILEDLSNEDSNC